MIVSTAIKKLPKAFANEVSNQWSDHSCLPFCRLSREMAGQSSGWAKNHKLRTADLAQLFYLRESLGAAGLAKAPRHEHFSISSTPVPSPASAKPAGPADITLRSGGLLSLAETSDLARAIPTTLVTLVGPPDAGKSTLLATVHECFRQNRFQGLSFSGSRTLVA